MKKLLKWILILLVVFVGLVVLIGIFGDNKSAKPAQSASENVTMQDEQLQQEDGENAQAEESVEQAIEVSSLQLSKDYENNEIAADKKYKGNLLQVTGKVQGIDSDFSNDAVVLLNANNQFMSVRATGDEAFNEYAATLSKGKSITLLCRGNGEVIGSASLKDCQPKP